MTANNYRGRLYSEAMQQTLSGQLAIWQDIEGESRIDDAERARLLEHCRSDIAFLLDLDMATTDDVQQALKTLKPSTPQREPLIRLLQGWMKQAA